ncbi:MAG: hypothetical protein D9C04_04155 [Nitrosopumilus sp. B06]|nr:MAG: hypothetical protein EB828_00590 [Nitrosopumilus sp. D6]RNJ79693.1 MAG: hypothetical protein D9C04_04155 [Nitrosopumilus sp. B06]
MSQDQIYRTTSARTGKMMVIMLGICLAGGVIFFAMWDYWISQPAPVVAMMAGDSAKPVATQTGKTITQDLAFVESDDFRILGFNELPGEEGGNPTINVQVGDKIVFNVVNDGLSYHSFGVTADEEGVTGIIEGSTIAMATNPLKPEESGTSEFVAGDAGTYYYICTVPGHRIQGMVGEIIVTEAGALATAAAPTGVSHDFELDFVESEDFRTLAFNELPGEEDSNPDIRVASGDEVTVTVENTGKSFHSFGVVTDPADFNSVVMDSAIASPRDPLKPGEEESVTFTAGAPGLYYYICTVPGHALQGMQGNFIVE